MNGSTNAKNNAGGKVFAAISVTYPSGSTCTCSDGSKTLKLKDTSGQGFFLIPYAATWTVSCTDGTNTESQAIIITAEGQSESVTLNYDLYIFKSGSGLATGCTFKNVQMSSSSKNSLIANTNDDYSNGSSFYITTNINFDGYSRLNFDLIGYKYTGQYNPNPNVRYGCSSNTNVTGDDKIPSASNFTVSSTSLPTTRKTVSVDISSVSNNDKYVKVETLDTRLVIYNIWLD